MVFYDKLRVHNSFCLRHVAVNIPHSVDKLHIIMFSNINFFEDYTLIVERKGPKQQIRSVWCTCRDNNAYQ